MTEATRLAEIQKRLEAATKGTWESWTSAKVPVCCVGAEIGGYMKRIAESSWHHDSPMFPTQAQTEANLAFIAAAPDDIAFLLDRIRELEAAQ